MTAFRLVLLAILSIIGVAASAAPQTTAFSYQGKLLQNGNPSSGNHSFAFTLWDAETGGTQVGPAISQSGYPVANGIFTIDLDFGANVFAGTQRWLNVVVDGNALTPRQPINSVPVAQFAMSGASGMSVSGNATNSQFSNDRLYAGISLTGQNLPMVMIGSAAFNPAGTTTRPGYPGGVDVYSVTSAATLTITTGGGGAVGRSSAGDTRFLVAIDPAYAAMSTQLLRGQTRAKLQVDVLRSPSSSVIVQSFCYGNVYVIGLQPMPQTGTYEMQIQYDTVGTRVAQINAAGTVTGYVESGWNFASAMVAAVPCVNPSP